MPSKKVVTVMYEYFYPGYKAGGPVQSLVNMIVALQDEFQFKVITTALDLNATTPYATVKQNQWNDVDLNNDGKKISVWYASSPAISLGAMQAIIKEAATDILYINGLFTKWFSMPLLLNKMGKLKNISIIVSPRGMLQAGALAVKPTKKTIFLNLFKTAGMFNNIKWHATTTDESDDIKQRISNNAAVLVAANIPKKPLVSITQPQKQVGILRLVYLSIITEKKNLLMLLQLLQSVRSNIYLDVYGPVKEEDYWQQCQQQIKLLPTNIHVEYKNDIAPHLVQQTIQQYQALILLTKGENFGHALYEGLSTGRPLITSYFTPWNNLEQKNAGWNLDITDKKQTIADIETIATLDNNAYAKFYNGAHDLAKHYYNNGDFINSYRKLFA